MWLSDRGRISSRLIPLVRLVAIFHFVLLTWLTRSKVRWIGSHLLLLLRLLLLLMLLLLLLMLLVLLLLQLLGLLVIRVELLLVLHLHHCLNSCVEYAQINGRIVVTSLIKWTLLLLLLLLLIWMLLVT